MLQRTIGIYHVMHTQIHDDFVRIKENRVEKETEQIIREKEKVTASPRTHTRSPMHK